MVALLPIAVLSMVLRLGTYLYVREIGVDRGFWLAYFHNLVCSLTKGELLHRFDTWIDFDRNYRFVRQYVEQARTVLIIEAEHDPLFRASERAALRALYPSAETHLFIGSGHAASLARTAEYVAVIEAMLASHKPDGSPPRVDWSDDPIQRGQGS
jgi:pimeloyl-ACP methyl ester carboxylesterase